MTQDHEKQIDELIVDADKVIGSGDICHSVYQEFMRSIPALKALRDERDRYKSLLEACLQGLKWRAENPLAGWDESDGEMALEIEQALKGGE